MTGLLFALLCWKFGLGLELGISLVYTCLLTVIFVIGLAAMALPFIIYRRGMGMGDVKLGALVGLMSGYPLVAIALLLAVITGGLVAAILLAFKIKKRRDPIPFAPFLATSAMVTLLWGQAIWQWYL
jgi:leader peptidase (prepilin peptidase)/N-methyltransferase